MNFVLDGILILVFILFVVFSAKKGFLSASKNILSLILTAILIATMHQTILTALQSSPIGSGIRTAVAKNISKTYEKEQLPDDIDTTETEESEKVYDALKLPSFIEKGIRETTEGMTELKNNLMDIIIDSVTDAILKIIGILLVFLIIRVLVFLLIKILDSLFKLPGLRTINRFFGAILGAINAVIVISIVLGILSLFAQAEKMQAVKTAIDGTYLLKYLYENNLLLSLFM